MAHSCHSSNTGNTGGQEAREEEAGPRVQAEMVKICGLAVTGGLERERGDNQRYFQWKHLYTSIERVKGIGFSPL